MTLDMIFHHTDNLKGCVIAETKDVSERFADVTVRSDVSLGEGLVDDGDARRFPGFTLGKFAAVQQRNLHGGEILRTDLIGLGVDKLFPSGAV